MAKKRSSRRHGAPLGQHFLNAPWVAAKLVESCALSAGDTVLEIGPGKGALTRTLLATGARVIAVEKDDSLIEILQHTFNKEIEDGTLTLIHTDIRDFSPESVGLTRGSYILAANIPYYITGEILRQFLTADAQPRRVALLVQKEVAERIACLPAGRQKPKESILSLSVKIYGTPQLVQKVSRGDFSPPPSVDSAILLVRDISRKRLRDTSEENFFRVVRAGFSSKRKLLANNLAAIFGKEQISRVFELCGIDKNARAETVNLEKWMALVRLAP